MIKWIQKRVRGGVEWARQRKLMVGVVLVVVALLIGPSVYSQAVTGGFESITAEWDEITWRQYTDTGGTTWPEYRLDVDFTTGTWDGNDRFGPPTWGVSDWARYRLETDQPKYYRTIEDHTWTVNGDPVVDASGNVTGVEQREYQWSLDVYRVMVSISTVASYGTFACDGAQFWLRFQNNAFSVFENADNAAGYVIQAHVVDYNYTANHPHHVVVPSQGAFTLDFVGTNEVSPREDFEEGSDIDIAALTKFSDVRIPFEVVDLSPAVGGVDCTVDILVDLDVIVVGQWDYVLDYDTGGRDRGGTGGSSGIFSYFTAFGDYIMDNVPEFFNSLDLSFLVPVAVIAVAAVVVVRVVPGLLRSARGKVNKR